ncbi:MAG: Ig-like domain-containing protein [Bacteroidota bacterium]
MKYKLFITAFSLAFFWGCIGTDLEDELPEAIRIEAPEAPLRVNGQIELIAEFRDNSGQVLMVDVNWSSSAPDIVEVVDNKYAVGRSEGTAVITASASSPSDPDLQLTTELEITVEFSKEELTISTFMNPISVGSEFQFGVNYLNVDGENVSIPVTWESSNPSVATVSSSGVVSGISEGNTDIIATAGNVVDRLTIEITEMPIQTDPEIRFLTFDNSLSTGESFQFTASFYDESAMEDTSIPIAWSSSYTDVLTIDENGLAVAIAEGVANVTASGGGVNATISVVIESDAAMPRTGSLRGTGYDIEGSFTLSENEDGDLILSFENAMIDRNAPGPYFYLTNMDRNVSGGVNLGKSQNGTFSINVSAEFPDVRLSTYQHVMVWCEPFNVRLGIGTFEN